MSKEIYHSSQEDMDSEVSFDSTGKQKSFRRLITRFAEKTSMQGPPYINMAKLWWAKVIWAILLLCAVAAMSLHLWYLFFQWYSWPKTTVISLGFDDLIFPQVTICNTNILHKNRFDKYKGAKELKMLVDDLKPENFVPHQFNENYDPDTDKKIPPGMHRQDGNQQGGTEQGGNQTEQSGNQQSGTEQGGNQQGETDQGGNLPNGTDQGGSQQGGTTETGRNRPTSNTTQTRTPTRSMENKQIQTTPSPRSRKKRFDGNYEYLNVSDYVEEYQDIDEDAGGLNSPIDSQTKLEKVFRQLYMDIERPRRRQLGHDIKDMLVGCTFNGRRCNSDFFQLHQTSEYGNCWTISSDKFVVKRSGPGGGLSIVLFLETSEYLKGLTTGYGARIQFQEQDTYPFPFDQGVFISGAMETDIGLKFRTVNRLGGDFGSCNDGVEFMKWYNLTYTRRACQAFCRITTVIKTCNCFDDDWEEFAFKKDNTLRPCRSAKEKECLRGVLHKYGPGALWHLDNPCDTTVFVRHWWRFGSRWAFKYEFLRGDNFFHEFFDLVLKTKNSQHANTKSKDNEGRKSPEHTVGNEKEPEHKLPRFAFNPIDRLPHHMQDESPFREQDSSYHSDTGSYDNRHQRKHDLDLYGSHSPNLRVHGGSPFLGRGRYLEPDRISYNSDRGSDHRRHRTKVGQGPKDIPRRVKKIKKS
ncbi:uncharacterized protein LOC123525591 [Mercenaria mercenaria]|uniref:uncharacterized protein LOC123525591 n=1 Tax=Mercenaria mercenaria TaxID=6596 RepID=UPI00234EC92F|nr:uncharacterized protein LOC123525591 [Mercenaria mercenaria]